jgi:hypothetical protein
MNSTHIGHGGVANVFMPSNEDIEAAKRDNGWEVAVGDGKAPAEKGLVEKGKEFLGGLIGKKLGDGMEGVVICS